MSQFPIMFGLKMKIQDHWDWALGYWVIGILLNDLHHFLNDVLMNYINSL
jgi:hypothetical protein